MRMRKLLPVALHAGLAVLLVAGCAKRPATSTMTVPPPTGRDTPHLDNTARVEPLTLRPTTPSAASPMKVDDTRRPLIEGFRENAALKDVHFDFDKYEIRAADAKILDENAKWLKTNPGYLVLIEGHADERGTNEYNLALGERRSKATMTYLVSQGVPSSRLTTISYGEERPACKEHTESCWAKNRRAHFLVKSQ